jgi:hypothetical protein
MSIIISSVSWLSVFHFDYVFTNEKIYVQAIDVICLVNIFSQNCKNGCLFIYLLTL